MNVTTTVFMIVVALILTIVSFLVPIDVRIPLIITLIALVVERKGA